MRRVSKRKSYYVKNYRHFDLGLILIGRSSGLKKNLSTRKKGKENFRKTL